MWLKRSSIRTVLRTPHRRVRGLANTMRLSMDAEMSLSQGLARWARRRGQSPCLIFEGKCWTYSEVDALVDRRAALFASQGVGKGDSVAMMMDNRPAFIINVLALNRIGAVPALVNDRIRSAGLRHAVLVTSPMATLVSGAYLDAFRAAFEGHTEALTGPVWIDWEGAPTSALQGRERDLAELDDGSLRTPPRVKSLGRDLCAHIFTSGTTGLPKASRIINARTIMAAEGWGATVLTMGPGDVMYCCLPLFHSNGFLVSMSMTLWNGAAYALARRFSARRFWQDIRETGATSFIYIGEICRYLLGRPPEPTDGEHNLRSIIGNGLRPENWDEFVERFQPGFVHEFYGSTEGNVNILNVIGRRGSVGKLPYFLDNTLLVQFDDETQAPRRDKRGRCIPCKRGQVGELLGRIVTDKATKRFEGYTDSKATEDKILRDVRKPGDAYFRTGDLLKRDWLGYYSFVDRVGDTFRWKGENVSTMEVGDIIHTYPGIELTNVYGVQIAGSDGRAGMVALAFDEGVTFDPDAFYAHVERELPPYARPAFVRVVEQMALTATLKVRKVDFVREGFDPTRISDPLYYRDDEARRYRILDAEGYQKVLDGQLRF